MTTSAAFFFSLALCAAAIADTLCGKFLIKHSQSSFSERYLVHRDPEFGTKAHIILRNHDSDILTKLATREEYCFEGQFENFSSQIFLVREVYPY